MTFWDFADKNPIGGSFIFCVGWYLAVCALQVWNNKK